jgi:hypothetical protein
MQGVDWQELTLQAGQEGRTGQELADRQTHRRKRVERREGID